jgi:inosine-uridine nucleoside N-ribohydrolase
MKRLLIDTDVALGVWHEDRPRDIDDGFAMVEAINSDLIDLRGVTCVFGNGPIDEVYRVANDIVRLKGATTPVLRGAAVPMTQCDETNPAVEFLAERLAAAPHHIAAIGPLTNIGLLVKHYPEVISNIEQLIMVAGRSKGADFYIGDDGPVRDFNFENDVQAAEIIVAAGIPCVLMGFELTSQVCVTADDLQAIGNRKHPTAKYFYDNSLAWCDHWTSTFPTDEGFHPWDSAAIAWLLNQAWFAHESRGSKITNEPPRWECDSAFPGPQLTYCTGFTDGGASAFVARVVEEVY